MRLILPFLLAAAISTPAMAAFQGPGTTTPEITVAQIKNVHDDAIVTLTGNVIKKIDGTKDKYIFKDNTGEIRIEIDHKYLPAQDFGPQNVVRITGEVDKDWTGPAEIDVKRVEILK